MSCLPPPSHVLLAELRDAGAYQAAGFGPPAGVSELKEEIQHSRWLRFLWEVCNLSLCLRYSMHLINSDLNPETSRLPGDECRMTPRHTGYDVSEMHRTPIQ